MRNFLTQDSERNSKQRTVAARFLRQLISDNGKELHNYTHAKYITLYEFVETILVE